MGTIMVKCPDTGHDISTGIVADRASFNATPVFFARVYCPCAGPSTNGSPRKPGCTMPNPCRRPNGRLTQT